MPVQWTMPKTPGEWAVAVLGSMLFFLGVVLLLGGVWLITLGGSWYYALAGLALIASGWFLLQRNILGAWIYIGLFVFTLLWAVWEVGLNGWALLPRAFGPLVLLLLVVLSLLTLDKERGRRFALIGSAAWLALVIVGGFAISSASAPRAPAPMPPQLATMTDPSLMQAAADWPAYGATYAARRYSPLTQITTANVGKLERAWEFRTGDTPEKDWGAETTPIKVGNRLYLCSGRNIMFALDAATGAEIWRHDPKVSDDFIPYTAACRGVTYFAASPTANVADGCQERIMEGTLDGRLIAVNAQTGQRCANFGANGEVSITTGMGDVVPGMVSITSAPTIVRGVVVTGHQVLDGQKRSAPSGVIQGFDAITGELRWAWDMTHPDWSGLPPEGQTWTRGTPNMWTTATGDEQLGLVYLPMGNSAVDYWSSMRSPQEDEYTASLVALDVTTGKPAWHFRTVNVDVWDYDLGSQPTLIDYPRGNETIPAVILPSKQGEIYILDRRTGQPLHPVEMRQVPQGGVEPERRAATQPYSGFHSLAMRDLEEKDMWGMSPIDQMICRIQFRQAEYKGPYTPPTSDTHWIQYPGYNGGSDWGGIAVDPVRGVIVANYNDMPNYNRLVPRAEADAKGWAPRGEERGGSLGGGAEGAGDPQAGTPYAIDVNAGWRMPFTNLLCKQPPYGGIRAINLATGETIWDRPLGTARKNGPFKVPTGLPFDIGTPNNGGAVVTARGLIFIAAATDDLIRAIDITTGKTVWQDDLPAGGQANPMMYEANGRQYLVIMAGGHHFMETPKGDYVIAYALPRGS
jgi:quinoprotein glucose dehydrogenase